MHVPKYYKCKEPGYSFRTRTETPLFTGWKHDSGLPSCHLEGDEREEVRNYGSFENIKLRAVVLQLGCSGGGLPSPKKGPLPNTRGQELCEGTPLLFGKKRTVYGTRCTVLRYTHIANNTANPSNPISLTEWSTSLAH